MLEEKLAALTSEINKDENISDYVKLTELQNDIDNTEEELLLAMEELENLMSQV